MSTKIFQLSLWSPQHCLYSVSSTLLWPLYSSMGPERSKIFILHHPSMPIHMSSLFSKSWENAVKISGKTWTPSAMDDSHYPWAYLAHNPNYWLTLVSPQDFRKPKFNHCCFQYRRISSSFLPASHCLLFQVCSSNKFFKIFCLYVCIWTFRMQLMVGHRTSSYTQLVEK